jgi:hypothetical protein
MGLDPNNDLKRIIDHILLITAEIQHFDILQSSAVHGIAQRNPLRGTERTILIVLSDEMKCKSG